MDGLSAIHVEANQPHAATESEQRQQHISNPEQIRHHPRQEFSINAKVAN
jgi:hypothetical protein